jgi:hypothetical protein
MADYAHTDITIGRDESGKARIIKAGSEVTVGKDGLSKEDMELFKEEGIVSSKKYEPVAVNDTVPQASTLEEREAGEADGARSVTVR